MLEPASYQVNGDICGFTAPSYVSTALRCLGAMGAWQNSSIMSTLFYTGATVRWWKNLRWNLDFTVRLLTMSIVRLVLLHPQRQKFSLLIWSLSTLVSEMMITYFHFNFWTMKASPVYKAFSLALYPWSHLSSSVVSQTWESLIWVWCMSLERISKIPCPVAVILSV